MPIPMPSKLAHNIKLILSVIGVVSGAVLAIYAPAYVQPVAAVISAVSGLFGAQEVKSHQQSWQTYSASVSTLPKAA